MMKRNVQIFADRASLIAEARQIVLEQAQQSPRFTIALAGGSTPKPLYQSLAQCDTDWQKWHIFFGDERFVPHDDPQSNYRMVREAWLDHVPIPPSHIHPMPTGGSDAQASCAQYAQELANFFGVAVGTLPQFDLILLGMGDDGHTASLFPSTPALEVNDRLVTLGQKDSQIRLTLTVPTINNAKQIIFLVEGSAKASTLAAVLAETGDSAHYPARLISDRAIWLVDRAAAQHINTIGKTMGA